LIANVTDAVALMLYLVSALHHENMHSMESMVPSASNWPKICQI